MDRWVHQNRGNGLGNFVMCTPTIITLHNHFKEKIPVYFDDEYLKELYNGWDKITVLSNKGLPKHKMFGSDLMNLKIPDWKYIHDKITKKMNIEVDKIPHTYAPLFQCTPEYEKEKYCVIVRGCIKNSYWKIKKDVGDEIYKQIMHTIMNKGIQIVMVGNSHDFDSHLRKMATWGKKYKVDRDNIRRAVSLIANAKFVVSNDSGLYHVAGALNKHTFVMWKDTPFEKNKSPGENCCFSKKNNWMKDFEKWIAVRS